MPGLTQKCGQLGNAPPPLCSPQVAAVGSAAAKGIWSKHRDDITFDQLQKFWSDLPPHARRELLRIDKQTLFEQARKNLYCSRCNGLLLEGFSQIVMYGKSLQQDGDGVLPLSKVSAVKSGIDKESDDLQDPSVHPWGGLVGTRDGMLTLLDCFIYGKSLWPLQNDSVITEFDGVFDSARARERERELLYPDACGGGGRGWISQGMAGYGRGHGTRETCALHTARLSCDTLVDFWSALGDETRLSLLRMKEEDFIERLMYRFDSKRFCRDCRRNVIREFKELKELKRMRREPRCTTWFCVADTSFQYEVSDDSVLADWHQSFKETIGAYHHFEWAIGTGEGKSDILEFEDVGINGKVQVDGLDLGDLSACFITLRAWRLDGRCTEVTVKAHGLKGQPCVHRRLVVGEGYVTITKGESIRRFFEHAEEVEEEEDDESIDKDGNELDGDGSRPQKHAKSPELAREFLLDAATVIFKEQASEDEMKMGNWHRETPSAGILRDEIDNLAPAWVKYPCWDFSGLPITAPAGHISPIKLLEEEEKEKREEEERKERKRTKEREKKLRRKERLKVKEKGRERKDTELKSLPSVLPSVSANESSSSTVDEPPTGLDSEDSIGDTEEMILSRPCSLDIIDEPSSGYVSSEINARDDNDAFVLEQSKSSRRKSRFKNSHPDGASKWCDRRQYAIDNGVGCLHDDSEKVFHGYTMASSRYNNGEHRQFTANALKTNARDCGLKFSEKLYCSNNRVRDRFDFHSCGCNQHIDYSAKEGQHISTMRTGQENKIANKTGSFDTGGPLHRSGKYGHGYFMPDNFVISKGNMCISGIASRRGKLHQTKQVWEPTDPQKRCSRSNSDSTSRPLSKTEPSEKAGCDEAENRCEEASVPSIHKKLDNHSSFEVSINLVNAEAIDAYQCQKGDKSGDAECTVLGLETRSHYYSKNGADEEVDLGPIPSYSIHNACDSLMSSSSSDNCSSGLSEGDTSTSSSSTHNAESSSVSDSEDASQNSEGREISACSENAPKACHDGAEDGKPGANEGYSFPIVNSTGFAAAGCRAANFPREKSFETGYSLDNELVGYEVAPQQRHVLPMHNQQLHLPMFPLTPMGYHNQSPAPWTSIPANQMVSFPQHHHLMFPRPHGYGMVTSPSSDFCMEYNPSQPATAHHLGQYPPYPFGSEANIVHSNQMNEHQRIFKFSRAGGKFVPETVGCARHIDHPVPSRQTQKTHSAQENGSHDDAKSHNAPSFSLFHFGGPMAMASGYDLNPTSLEEERNGGVFPNLLEKQTVTNCNKKEIKVEEYSLFSSNNGVRFSLLG
ncbi:hypothetical protein Taro_020503 [Colocasia esculenta]|uniref:Uncharacterized protein n=1 Tax=Colocasia esculenta TaxID=4460 RepID=A0A843UNU7_COLES|nr:hypothetical protein [Colocasia esculenta]